MVDAAVLWAVWENVVSWFVRTCCPDSWLRSLVPKCPEEETGGPSSRNEKSTKCVLIGRPGGTEQLRVTTLKQGIVTCGYNLSKFGGGPFAQLPPSGDDATATARIDDDCCVVVRVHAFSVNYADCCIRWGLYESAKQYVGYPICPGFDVAGVVERCIGADPAGTHNLKVGDHVFGCSLFGAYSTRVLVPALQLRKIPRQSTPAALPLLSMDEAAAIPAVALTALYALFLAGHYPSDMPLRYKNRSILIHSAAGGVGSMLIQMSRILGLSPIVGVVGRSSKIESAKALGCHVVVDKSACRSDKELWQQIRAAAPSGGYATVMESNGVLTLAKSYQHMSMTGRLIVYGFHTNLPLGRDMLSPIEWLKMGMKMINMPTFDAMQMGKENKAVLAFNLSFFSEERELLSQLFDQVCSWLLAGKLECPRIATFEMDQIAQAHEFIQSGTSVGKIVMKTT